MRLLAWLVAGLVAGWLAGLVMKRDGYGVLVDIVVGILGGIFGGWVFGMGGISHGGGMIGSIIGGSDPGVDYPFAKASLTGTNGTGDWPKNFGAAWAWPAPHK